MNISTILKSHDFLPDFAQPFCRDFGVASAGANPHDFGVASKLIAAALKNDFSRIDSLAIGCFDSLHLAHQKIISELGSNGALLCIDKGAPRSLLPNAYKPLFAQNHLVLSLQLDSVRTQSAAEFAKKLREIFSGVKYFVQGYDFRFGANAAGSAMELGEHVRVINELKINQISVHSGKIKELLARADMAQAARLLGRNYCVAGKCVRSQGIGAREMVPTINIDASEWILPADGVYYGQIAVLYEDLSAILRSHDFGVASAQQPKSYAAAIFVGTRSTDGARTLEAHVLDDYAAANHSERFAWCAFLRFLRPARQFASINDLKAQIFKDLEQIRSMHER